MRPSFLASWPKHSDIFEAGVEDSIVFEHRPSGPWERWSEWRTLDHYFVVRQVAVQILGYRAARRATFSLSTCADERESVVLGACDATFGAHATQPGVYAPVYSIVFAPGEQPMVAVTLYPESLPHRWRDFPRWLYRRIRTWFADRWSPPTVRVVLRGVRARSS